ncbi:hypothetical protein LJC46_00095 [Desulfovibrio sp. OttesenSCG-928-G15]|nr:hypothetical protein [Desulfovibrio sp. OttesenSCG-928-G15]
MKNRFAYIFILAMLMCLSACAAKKNLTVMDKLDGEWTCDARATWALWHPGERFTQDNDYKALAQARLRLDMKNRKMVMWNEAFGPTSEVNSTLNIVSQAPNSITIDDGDVFELKDATTLFIHDPQNPQKGFVFKRRK